MSPVSNGEVYTFVFLWPPTHCRELQLLRVEKSMSAVDALMILNYNLKASLTTHAPVGDCYVAHI